MEIVTQQDKPLDASDIESLESAKYEIQNLRKIIHTIDVNALSEIGNAPPSVDAPSMEVTTTEKSQVDVARGQAIVNILREKMEQRYTCLRDVFLKMDNDQSGYVSKEEFQEKCSHWGINLCDEDFANINATYAHQETCVENDHGINYNEFLNMMTHTANYKPGEGEDDETSTVHLDKILKGKVMDGYDTMKQAFQAVDRDCSGKVERGELSRVFESFHVGHKESDLDNLFAEYDKNGDGVFSYGEFVKIMSHHKQ